jgi:Fic-DOC domain mobile mystery protein B
VTPDPLLATGAGHTELGEDEREGLIPSYIATRGELFEAEERNITKAMSRKNPIVSVLLDDAYLRSLHREMLGEVWLWAGHYRTRDTNIGLRFELIAGAVRDLVLDARVWVASQTYDPDELALRFHHRLVATHPFPNGNGRHGRIASDYLAMALGAERFSWGALSDGSTEELRSEYVAALRCADGGDLADLLRFARS